jgi:hypothetical protein
MYRVEQPASRSEPLAALAQYERLPVKLRKIDGPPSRQQVHGADEEHVGLMEEHLVRQPLAGGKRSERQINRATSHLFFEFVR